MCGIIGIASSDNQEFIQEPLLRKMTDLLQHRGPDDWGFYRNPGIGMGHRRLSIIDLDGGHQPMETPDGTLSVVYNGEIYNFQELRKELGIRGHTFRTKSDTEVLLFGYRQWGYDLIRRLNGMFAFALWDSRRQTLMLFRDRMGVKPLYWAQHENKLIFASEIKSILSFPGFERRANMDAISSYLTFRQAIWNLSFFEGIHKLLPGHFLIYQSGRISIKTYYELPVPEIDECGDETRHLENIEALLTDSIRDRMISDVPLGAYLSGGLDSSLLVAIMAKLSPHPIKTFSIGYENQAYDEGPFAQMVSRHCGTEHHHLILPKEDYIEKWPKLILQRDIPLSIPHEIALHQLSLEIKKHVTVVLSGEGADELFGGYGRVQRSPMDWGKISFLRNMLSSKLADKISKRVPAHRLAAQLGISNHRDHFFNVYNWIPFQEKWDLLTDDANEALKGDSATIGIFDELFQKTQKLNPYDRVLYLFEKIHLNCLLDRLDMMSMAASVESRVPFVDDHRLVEYVMTIPFRYKMKWKSPLHKLTAGFYSSFKASEWLDINKHILRLLGAKYLPKKIAFRKKLGFPTPLDAWFKGGLLKFAKEILLDDMSKKRGLFDSEKLERLLLTRQELDFDFYGKKIWMILNIELWFRQFFPKSVSP